MKFNKIIKRGSFALPDFSDFNFVFRRVNALASHIHAKIMLIQTVAMKLNIEPNKNKQLEELKGHIDRTQS